MVASKGNAYAMIIGLHPDAVMRAIGEVDFEEERGRPIVRYLPLRSLQAGQKLRLGRVLQQADEMTAMTGRVERG